MRETRVFSVFRGSFTGREQCAQPKLREGSISVYRDNKKSQVLKYNY